MKAVIARTRKKLRKRVRVDDLTARQSQILTYFLRCWIRGYVPTVREIGVQHGISSPNGVHSHLRVLRKKSYLENDFGCGFKLTDKAMNLAFPASN